MLGLQLNIVHNQLASIYPYTQVMCSWSLDLMLKAELKSGNWKIQYGFQAAILKVTLLKINRLLSIYTSNLQLKFGLDIQSQPEIRIWKLKYPIWLQYGCQADISKVTLLKIDRLLSMHTSNLLLKFGLDIQSQTEIRIQKLKNPIWLPGWHSESDISENQ